MLQLIQIETTKPSIKSPAAFFTSVLRLNKINEAKKSFISNFPNRLNENDYWNQFCVNVLEGQDSFEVEYFFEISEEDNLQPIKNSIIVNYTFGSELEKIFRDNFQIFKRLFTEKLGDYHSNTGATKNKIEYVKDLQKKLIVVGKALEEMQDYKNIKDVLLRPLYAINRFIYIHYPEYALNPNVDHFLVKSLQSQTNTLHFIVEPIPVEKLLGIGSIRNLDGSLMFKFSVEDKNVEQKLRLLHERELDQIKTPIQIWGKSMKVDYLIHKICGALNFSLTDVASRKIFFNNRLPLNPDCCYSNTSRIGSSIDGAKDIIDIYFSNPITGR